MANKESQFKKLFKKQKFIPALIIVVLALVGVRLLILGHAQSPYASVEAESGTLTSGAAIVSDSTASGGSAVQFNAATTTTPTGVPMRGVGAIDLPADCSDIQTLGVSWYYNWEQTSPCTYSSSAPFVPMIWGNW